MIATLEVPGDWKKLRRIFVDAEVNGEAAAQRTVGSLYAFGFESGDPNDGVRQDPERAIRWLSTAAAKDDAEAHYLLGQCFDPGRLNFLCEPDIAMNCYRRAATLGVADARIALAELHLSGRGEQSSPRLGWQMLLREAYGGSREARMRVASLLDDDGRKVMGAAWRIVAGETMKRAPKGAIEVAGLIQQISWFYRLVECGEERTLSNMQHWLRASFTP